MSPSQKLSIKIQKSLASCPLHLALQKLGGRWTLLILQELTQRPLRFSEIRRALAWVPGKAIARTLIRLQSEGLIKRTVTSDQRPKITYSLSSQDPLLRDVIEALTSWGAGYNLPESKKGWGAFLSRVLLQEGYSSIRSSIVESWRRSRNIELGPDRQGVILHPVPREQLRKLVSHNRHLLEIAKPLLNEFRKSLGSMVHVVYLTDGKGIILYSTGDQRIKRGCGLLPGFDWSERAMGTNGAGTAIATGMPIAVLGPEFGAFPSHNITCLGVPVHSPAGKIVGTINLSTRVSDADPQQLTALIEIAKVIERSPLLELDNGLPELKVSRPRPHPPSV